MVKTASLHSQEQRKWGRSLSPYISCPSEVRDKFWCWDGTGRYHLPLNLVWLSFDFPAQALIDLLGWGIPQAETSSPSLETFVNLSRQVLQGKRENDAPPRMPCPALHCNSKRFTINLPRADVISCIHSHFHLHPSTQPPRSHSSPFKSVSSLRPTVPSFHWPPPRTATLHQGMCAKSLQSCPTLCNPMDCSLPGSSVHGILQARILQGVACPPPGDLPDPGIEPVSLPSPALAAGFFTINATWEASPAMLLCSRNPRDIRD